jgi:hypothetical protein
MSEPQARSRADVYQQYFVPAFARLEAAERAALLEAVRAECRSVVQQHSDGAVVQFPMHAHVVLAAL